MKKTNLIVLLSLFLNQTLQAQIELKDGTTSEHKNKKPLVIKTKGYFNNSAIGILVGTNRYNAMVNNFSLHTVNGYMVNPHLQAGIGLGLEVIQKRIFFPLFADVRYNFKKGDFSPFIGTQVGVTFRDFEKRGYFPCYYNDCSRSRYITTQPYPSDNDMDGGLMASLQLGIKHYVNNGFGYTVSIGYRMQELLGYGFREWDYFEIEKEINYLHRLDLKIGVVFN